MENSSDIGFEVVINVAGDDPEVQKLRAWKNERWLVLQQADGADPDEKHTILIDLRRVRTFIQAIEALRCAQ